MMSFKQWLLLGFIALVVFGVLAAAQDDDEEKVGETVEGQNIEEVTDGIDAEDAAEELEEEMDAGDSDSTGLKGAAYFPKYADLYVPAGDRIEILVPVSNAEGNPTYEVALVAGHLATLDQSRFLQNFSAQVYDRKLEAGETATVKYSVTPDALIEPMEYAFIVAAYLKTDDNNTLMVPAYNGTIHIQDPLGFDFKGTFGLLAFFGGIAAAVYFYMNNGKKAAPARSAAVELGTTKMSVTEVDASFIDPQHAKFLEKQRRGRSASPKK